MSMSSVTAQDLVTDMAGLQQSTGLQLGPTEWREMTQEQINQFAGLTGDHNFLHVDPERAKSTPFGGTIAHGFLSLSLLAPVTQRVQVTDAATNINYGLDKVRFPAPLPVGAQWRASAEITDVTEIKGGVQAKMIASLEVKGSERPAVVAESLIRFYA
jgi:acyl dehydratase